jgi:hypothetical protein
MMTEAALAEGSSLQDPRLAEHVIRGLEDRFDVNSLVYRDMRVWPWIRNALYFHIQSGRGPLSRLRSRARTTQQTPDIPGALRAFEEFSLRVLLRAGASGANTLPFRRLEPAEILFVTQGRRRPASVDGRRFDVQLDPIIRIVDRRWTWHKIALSNHPTGRGANLFCPAHQVSSESFLELLGRLDGFHALLFGASGGLQGWNALIEALARGFRVVSVPVDPAAFLLDLIAIERLSLFSELMLDHLRPRLVIFVGQNVRTFALARACYRRGIACADVQHGTGALGPDKIKWFGWRQVPPGGYELLPDYFLVWGEEAVRRLTVSVAGDGGRHVPLLFGNPWLGQFDASRAGRDATSSRKAILVTLVSLAVADVPEHLMQVMANSQADWRWYLRLHPMDAADEARIGVLKARLAGHDIRNVDISYASTAALPELLGKVDRHVTLYSSACYEATAFGLGTIFIHPAAANSYSDLLRRPGFRLALDAGTLAAALSEGAQRVEPLIVSDESIALSALGTALTIGPRRKSMARRA